jgi:subtilisin family serine protease
MKFRFLDLFAVALLLLATSIAAAQPPPRERPAGATVQQPSIQPRATAGAVNPAHIRGFEAMRDQAAQGNRRVRVIARLTRAAVDGAPTPADVTPASFTHPAAGLGAAQARIGNRLTRLGLPHVAAIAGLPFMVVEASAEELAQMIAEGEIAEVVEDDLSAPMLAESAPLVRAPGPALSRAKVTIAVLDTGIETSHPFFGSRVVEEACFSSNSTASNATSLCPGGAQSSTQPGSAAPCSVARCDHGTHVAGIAAGQRSLRIPFSGIAPDANLYSIQVFSLVTDTSNNRPCANAGTGSPCLLAFTSDIIRALQRVRDRRSAHNIVAVNMSLGGGKFTTACDNDPRKPVIDELRAAGVATVIAAGNAGLRDAVGSPACISSAIAVGSTTKTDTVSTFSNISSLVDVLAPGGDIRSSVPLRGNTEIKSGTSMAAPHVAGAVAAIRLRQPSASVDQIEQWLKVNGVPISIAGVTLPRIDVDSAARTRRAAQFALAQTYTMDFDNGQNSGATADLWFQAETATALYLVPRNGASMWVSSGIARGYAGCSAGTAYSTQRVALSNVPIGSVVCIRTNEGRLSQFRLDRISTNSPRTLGISYVTWNN